MFFRLKTFTQGRLPSADASSLSISRCATLTDLLGIVLLTLFLPFPAAAAGTSETRIYDNPVRLRQLIRPRPSSLSVEKRQFLRSASQDNANDRSGNREVFTLKRSLKVFLRSNETDLFENINSVVSRNVINRTSQLGQFCELCSSILRKERLYLS